MNNQLSWISFNDHWYVQEKIILGMINDNIMRADLQIVDSFKVGIITCQYDNKKKSGSFYFPKL